jgi:hypothetical protein
MLGVAEVSRTRGASASTQSKCSARSELAAGGFLLNNLGPK